MLQIIHEGISRTDIEVFLHFFKERIDAQRALVPDLPDVLVARYTSPPHSLTPYDAETIVADPSAASLFEVCLVFNELSLSIAK